MSDEIIKIWLIWIWLSKVLDLGSISPKFFFSQESNVKPKLKC